MLFLLGSSTCKHIFKWGKTVGNMCNRPSKYRDSLCFKHRYRYVESFTKIYRSFKYLFDLDIKIIKNKKSVQKLLYKNIKQENENNEKKTIEKLKIENENILTKSETISHYEYIDNLKLLTMNLINVYDKNIIHKLISHYVYKYIPDKLGTRGYVDYSNYYLRKIQRPYF